MGTRLVHLLFLSLLGVSLFSVVGWYKTPLLLASMSGDRHICIYVLWLCTCVIYFIERCIYRHSYGDNCSQRDKKGGKEGLYISSTSCFLHLRQMLVWIVMNVSEIPLPVLFVCGFSTCPQPIFYPFLWVFLMVKASLLLVSYL